MISVCLNLVIRRLVDVLIFNVKLHVCTFEGVLKIHGIL